MNLDAARSLALNLMAHYGLIAKGWSFSFNNRRRHFGVCSYKKRTIFLSCHLTVLNDEVEVKDTILHEIAHALAGSQAGHGRMWKLQAVAVGARPQACTSSAMTVEGKWQASCPSCGFVYHFHRRPKLSKNRACAFCCRKHNGGYYSEQFKLNFVEVR